MGTKRLPSFCAHSVFSGRPQTRAVPSSDNHTSLDWSGQNHQLIQLLIVFTAVVCMCQDTQPQLLLIKV